MDDREGSPEPEHVEWNLPETVSDPAWAARRELAASLRDLAVRMNATDAPIEVLESVRAAIDAQRAVLAAAPRKTNRDAFRDGTFFDEPLRYKDRTAMIGLSNPISGPLRMRYEDGKVIGEITCGQTYVGAPGLVHGGLVAALLDEILGHVGIRLGGGMVTSTLSIRYVKPTPLEVPLRVEAWLVAREGRRYHTAGHVLADGVVTAKAEGVFVDVRGERFRKILEEL